jgi:hypothetical protein
MGNIITSNQYNRIPKLNYIKKDDHPNSIYYSNNFIREWIAENKIDVSYHKWLPLGVNYTTLYTISNNTIMCEVCDVRSYFSKTKLTMQIHLSNINILDNNCYILLSQKQERMLGLTSNAPKNEESINSEICEQITQDETEESINSEICEQITQDETEESINSEICEQITQDETEVKTIFDIVREFENSEPNIPVFNFNSVILENRLDILSDEDIDENRLDILSDEDTYEKDISDADIYDDYEIMEQ